MEKWIKELNNYVTTNNLEYQYKNNFLKATTRDEKLTIALQGAFIFATTLVSAGELGNIFSFIAYNLREA